MVNRESAWVTMPVVRSYHGLRNIHEIQINESTPWREKLLKTVRTNYSRAPFFADIFSWLTKVVKNPTKSLVEYNTAAIQAIAATLDLDRSKLVLGSELDVEGKATDLLISMVNATDGSVYLSGGGAGGYQEDEKFAKAGIELIYQNFRHPTYPQCNTSHFISGLSIIDALMNCGFEQTKKLVLDTSQEARGSF